MHTTGQFEAKAMQDVEERFNVCYGEITVMCGPNIRKDTKEAFRRSLALIESGQFAKALVVTTGCTSRRSLAWAREVDGQCIGEQPTKNDVVVYPCVGGKLCKEIPTIEAMLERHAIDVLMINSWEFTSMHPRYKDELLFALQRLTEQYRLTVVIFSHMNGSPTEVGCIQRGTLGKLSVIASKIVSLDSEEELAEERTVMQQRRTSAAPARSGRFVGTDGSVDLGAMHTVAEDAHEAAYAREEAELELVE